jgi:hypothetical protein
MLRELRHRYYSRDRANPGPEFDPVHLRKQRSSRSFTSVDHPMSSPLPEIGNQRSPVLSTSGFFPPGESDATTRDAVGRVIVNVVPSPGVLATSSRPPWRCTML